MLNEILENLIEKRSWEVVLVCEESNQNAATEFEATIKKLSNRLQSEFINDLSLLEELFHQNQTNIIKQAYRIGFEDSIIFKKEIQKML